MMMTNIYRVGERVTVSGWYVCVPCGYKAHLSVGERFPPCINCMRVSRPFNEMELALAAAEGAEPDEFDEGTVAGGLELWELKRRDRAAL